MCDWASTSVFFGDQLLFRNGLRKSISSVRFLVDMHSTKQDSTGMGQKKKLNPHAQALGSLGGKARAENLSQVDITKIASQGGRARAESLSAARRREIAVKAVAVRERKKKENTSEDPKAKRTNRSHR